MTTKTKRASAAPTKKKRAAPTPPPFPPMLVSIDDAAALLRVSSYQVYRLVQTGMLPSLKIGRYRRISVKALDIYVNGAIAS
jgi:excisionase family DNA binding protein